jgi:hypothetical protein
VKRVDENGDESSASEQEEIDETVLSKFVKDVSCGLTNLFSLGNSKSTLKAWRRKKRLKENTERKSMTLKSNELFNK